MSAVMPRALTDTSRSDTLYAADDGMVAQLSSQECMIQNPRTQERHVMTFEVFQALDQCKRFATISGDTIYQKRLSSSVKRRAK